MALRFVDFGRQLDPDGPRRFGFWDLGQGGDDLGGLARLSWTSWREFEEYVSYLEPNFDAIFRPLCPPWVFGGLEPDLSQLEIFCDCLAQDMDYPVEAEQIRELVLAERARSEVIEPWFHEEEEATPITELTQDSIISREDREARTYSYRDRTSGALISIGPETIVPNDVTILVSSAIMPDSRPELPLPKTHLPRPVIR